MGIWPNHRAISTHLEDTKAAIFKQLCLEDGETPASMARLLILAHIKQRTEERAT